MKRFFSAIGLCTLLIFTGVALFLPKSEAQNNILQSLLDLPAPPPPNTLIDKQLLSRRQDSYLDKEKPSEDASIEDLMAYWEIYGQTDSDLVYSPKPTEKTLDRIIEEIEKNPVNLTKYLNTLPTKPKYADFVKRLYDQEVSDRKIGREWREAVKFWLSNHSSYYSEDLVKSAQEVKDTGEYVTNQEFLLSLAKVDWDKARPIVERLMNDSSQPISQTLARWVAYRHATEEGDSIEADKYRKALQETVENKNEKPGNRDLAMDAIVKVGDFNGRDDWYFSLLEDETLYDLRVGGSSYTGLTTLLNMSPPEKYKAKMIELVGSNNQTIRNAAARNLGTLINYGDPEVLKALLPWLENTKWAIEVGGERQRLVEQLRIKQIPESVSGLLFVLNEKAKRTDVVYDSPANTAVNAPVITRTPNTERTVEVEYYPFRSAAIWALGTQKDMRAITALRTILPVVDQYERTIVIKALLDCNGFSVLEQVQAIEVVAKNMSKISNQSANKVAVNAMPAATAGISINEYGSNSAYDANKPFNPSEVPMLLGSNLLQNQEVSEELITAVVERIKVLEKKSPQIASIMRNIIKNWSGKGVNSLMLKDLKTNSTDITSVIKLLTLRKELREKQNNEVFDIRGGSPLALGISACILEDNNEYDALLAGNNDEAKTAMLGCAKLLRANLPIQKVAENLKSPNKMLALAAERFLESEDSPQARQIVLSLHPNEAKILGATTLFTFTETYGEGYEQIVELLASLSGDNKSGGYDSNLYFANSAELTENAKKLQKEVKENAELIGIYSFDKNFVRIFKDKAVFSWEEDSARYRERTLSKEEFGNLTSYLSYNQVDELPAFVTFCDYCDGKELLMLGKQGGRRVFLKGDYKPKFFVELGQMFEDMRRPPAKLHYWLEKYVTGLEVLFEDKNLEAQTVWKTGDEVKLLISDANRKKQIEKELDFQEENEDTKAPEDATDEYYQKQETARFKRRQQKEFEEFSWYKLENNKLGPIIGQPAEVEFLPKSDNLEKSEGQWKARTANLEIHTDGTALYKVVRGQKTKIKTGTYYTPVVTGNGNWVVATKEIEYQQVLVRINLLTNKEFKVKPPGEASAINAEVFIPALNKMLIFSGYYYQYDGEDGEGTRTNSNKNSQKDGTFFLLDADTGIFQEVKGEVTPLIQQTFRSLQPTGNPNEFWAAIKNDKYTEFGRYDSKLLKFKPMIKLPEIEYESLNMFVDEKEAKIYLVYAGQLLRIPLPK
jgi:hypothetical protein